MKIAIAIIKQNFVSGKTAFVCICDNTQVLTQLRTIQENDMVHPVILLETEDTDDCDFMNAWIGDKSIEFDDQYPISYKFLTKIN